MVMWGSAHRIFDHVVESGRNLQHKFSGAMAATGRMLCIRSQPRVSATGSRLPMDASANLAASRACYCYI